MMRTTLDAPAPRRWLRRLGYAVLALAAGLVLALALALQTSPRVARPPDSASARHAMAAGEALRGFATTGGAPDSLTLSEDEIDAVMAAASRLAPGVDGAAHPTGSGVGLELSVGAPYLPQGLWANVALDVTATPEGLALERARIGRLPLPAGLVEAAAVAGADRLIGAPLARQALAGVTGLEVGDGAVTARFGYTASERRELIDRIRAAMGTEARDKGPIYTTLWWFDHGGETGELPKAGSALPYLRWGLERSPSVARKHAGVSDRDLATGALLALALYCGEPAIGPAIGVQLNDEMRGEKNYCEKTRLGGRDDLKRHFSVSAALYALSTGEAAFGVGELKELIDSGAGGTGFSFDDMAANLAGARFAAAFLEAPRSEWPAMLARIRSEADVLPDLTGLPTRLSEAEFTERFGAVDSPAYRAMIGEIEARVAALPLEAARR